MSIEERNKLLDQVQVCIQICKEYNIGCCLEPAEALLREMNEYKLIVAFEGKFSSGKSALLNCLLGSPLLPCDLLPTTAVATELVYDDNEFFELYFEDGTTLTGELSCFSDVASDSGAIKARLHVHADVLASCGCIPVDMPGFNSNEEAHNKAISQYLSQAGAYVIVIDCSDGDISSDTLNFIHELECYASELAVIITKCDKHLPDNVALVSEQIRKTVDINLGDVKVIATNMYDGDAKKKIVDVLQAFDSDSVFVHKYSARVAVLCATVRQTLTDLRDFAYLDTSEQENALTLRGYEQTRLPLQQRNDINKLKDKVLNKALANILERLQAVLLCVAPEMLECAKQGAERFSAFVMQNIRPVLMDEMGTEMQRFASELNDFIVCYHSTESQDEDMINNVTAAMQTCLDFAAAVTVRPELGLLSSVISMIKNIAVNITNNIRSEEALAQMRTSVIPRLLSSIRPHIEQYLTDAYDGLSTALIDQYEKKALAISEAIASIQEELESSRDEFDKYINGINDNLLLLAAKN